MLCNSKYLIYILSPVGVWLYYFRLRDKKLGGAQPTRECEKRLGSTQLGRSLVWRVRRVWPARARAWL